MITNFNHQVLFSSDSSFTITTFSDYDRFRIRDGSWDESVRLDAQRRFLSRSSLRANREVISHGAVDQINKWCDSHVTELAANSPIPRCYSHHAARVPRPRTVSTSRHWAVRTSPVSCASKLSVVCQNMSKRTKREMVVRWISLGNARLSALWKSVLAARTLRARRKSILVNSEVFSLNFAIKQKERSILGIKRC